MTFSPRTYLHSWSLYVRGVRWLWTRKDTLGGVHYKPGWGPWKFLPVYLTTYLVAVLCGLGVVSLSRWWYDRSEVAYLPGERHGVRILVGDKSHDMKWRHPFSRFMTRLLDRLFPGSAHGRHTGPILWGSKSAWND